jgi:lysophospholipase L1-like esterase
MNSIIKILCFGDSLTKGYYLDGHKYCPYSKILEIYLKDYYKHINFQVMEEGKDGECVVDEMEKRLETILKDKNFDYVILLGGLNDLGNDEIIDNIGKSFKNIYNLLDNNIYIKNFLHITVPFNTFDKFQSEKENKTNLNNYILTKNYSNKRFVIDVGNYQKYKFNYLYLDEYYRKKYWDDNLHFTPQGYELLAKCIFTSFIENIKLK